MSKITRQQIYDKVYSYPTRYKFGFTEEEIKAIFTEYPDMNMDKANDAMNGITVRVVDEQSVTPHSDVYTAIKCGVENRNMTMFEMD